jgi:hypothetical protein
VTPRLIFGLDEDELIRRVHEHLNDRTLVVPSAKLPVTKPVPPPKARPSPVMPPMPAPTAPAQHQTMRSGLEVLVLAIGNAICFDSEYGIRQYTMRKDDVLALCFHDDKLYDAGRYRQVLETAKGTPVVQEDKSITALCSHAGNLYHGTEDRIWETHKRIRVLKDYHLFLLSSLCSHNGTLHYTMSHWIGDEPNDMHFDRPKAIFTLCSHGGMLYDGGEYKEIRETVTGITIGERKGTIRALCSHRGKLLDAGDYKGIYEAHTGQLKVDTPRKIRAMTSIQGPFAEELIRCAETFPRIMRTRVWPFS